MTTEVGELLVRAWRAQTGGVRVGIYDEVLREVSARAVSVGSLGKADIGALVLWKRITAQATWSTDLMLTPDADVRAATGAAYRYANDTSEDVPEAGQAAREALRPVSGMGGTAALASAVLLALAPERMAVWDRRVGEALTALGMYPATRTGFYRQYLATALELAAKMNAAAVEESFVPRDVDLALFRVAGSPSLMAEAGGLARDG